MEKDKTEKEAAREQADRRILEVVNKQLGYLKYLEDHPVFDRNGATGTDIDGNTLSRLAVALATNNAFLGQIISHLQYEVDMLEAVRKNAWVDAFKDFKGLRPIDTKELASRLSKLADPLDDKKVASTEEVQKCLDEFIDNKIDGKKLTQKDAEVFADIAVEDMLKEEVEMKRMLLKVKNLRSDSSDMITAIQSRIGFLRDELRDKSMPNPM